MASCTWSTLESPALATDITKLACNVNVDKLALLCMSARGVMETKSLAVGVPVYGLSFCPERSLLAVVGGGGSSKSGVKNFIVAAMVYI